MNRASGMPSVADEMEGTKPMRSMRHRSIHAWFSGTSGAASVSGRHSKPNKN